MTILAQLPAPSFITDVAITRLSLLFCPASQATARPVEQSGRNSLYFSTAASTSPLQAVPILTLSDFHEISRAAGPK